MIMNDSITIQWLGWSGSELGVFIFPTKIGSQLELLRVSQAHDRWCPTFFAQNPACVLAFDKLVENEIPRENGLW